MSHRVLAAVFLAALGGAGLAVLRPDEDDSPEFAPPARDSLAARPSPGARATPPSRPLDEEPDAAGRPETDDGVRDDRVRELLVEAARRSAAMHEPGADRAGEAKALREALASLALLEGAGTALRLTALDDPDPALRALAVAALAERGDAEGLARCLEREPAPGIRLAAIEALGRLGGLAARRALARDFRERPTGSHRHRVARLLGRTGAVEASDDLAAAVRGDLDASVRLAALEALAELDSSLGREAAAAALDDENPRVRQRAQALFDSIR